MKKLLKFLCGRIFITGLLLLLQAVWLGVFFWKLAAYSVWLNAAFTLLSLLIVLHILYHDDVSGFKIGWIILILQLPVMGGLLYLLFGGKLPAHRMRRRLAAQHAETAAALGQDEAVFGALRGDDARAAARSRYITATGGYPVCMDSDVKYYPLGEEMYADMLRALESAEHFIFLEYFIIQPGKMWDGIAEILKRKAARGVDVRIVTPGVPDKKVVYRLTRSYYAPLLRAGVRIYEYTPGFIHAKSYLSDDTTGVVGTINMDYRSLYLHFECGTYLYRTPALQALKADVMDTLAKSREISPADCRRHFWSRMLDAVLRIAAPLC